MGCASSIVPQQQQQQNGASGQQARPKHKMNALVPEPPTRPATAVPAGPRVGLVSTAVLGDPTCTLSAASGVKDPHNYDELCVAFLKAAKGGDVPAMEALAQLAVKLKPTPQSLVNIRGMWESTPLVYATQYVHSAAAHWLLARGADVVAQNEKGVTPLLLASLEGMTDVCEKILSVAALMGSNNPPTNANIAPEDRGQTSPRAVDQQIGVVYNSAADINIRLSPLLAASMNGHAAIVALLLMHGADPNRPVGANAGGIALSVKQYALLLAAKYGHAAVLELLLAHGADCFVRDGGGCHALLLACENRREDCAIRLLRRTAVESAATDSGSKMISVWMQPNRHGITALHSAATHGLVSAATALVAHAREQTVIDGDSENSRKSLQAFLDAVSITRGETALLMACRKRQYEVAKVLLEAGADSRRSDRGGATAVQVLERSEQSELLEICGSAKSRAKSPNCSVEGTNTASPPIENAAEYTTSTSVDEARPIVPKTMETAHNSIESASMQLETLSPGKQEDQSPSITSDYSMPANPSSFLSALSQECNSGKVKGSVQSCDPSEKLDVSINETTGANSILKGCVLHEVTSDEVFTSNSSAPDQLATDKAMTSRAFEVEPQLPASILPTTRMEEEKAAASIVRSQMAAERTDDMECTPILIPELKVVGLDALASLDSASNPLRETSEYEVSERTWSSVSISPKKDKRKKSSKRKKKRDGDQDKSSPSRHHRGHRHRVAEGVADSDVGSDGCLEDAESPSHRRRGQDSNR